MAPRKGRLVNQAETFHPYGRELKAKQNLKDFYAANNVPFSQIQFEIINDRQNEAPPTWLVKETGNCYEFMVERRGLTHEEVEVQVEKKGESSTQRPGTSLTIFCERDRKLEALMHDNLRELHEEISRLYSQCQWKFARKFLLPADALPEGATAAHERGVVTVVVPRTCAWNPLLKFPSSAFSVELNSAKSNYLTAWSSLHRAEGQRIEYRDGEEAMQENESEGAARNASDSSALRIKWVNFSPSTPQQQSESSVRIEMVDDDCDAMDDS